VFARVVAGESAFGLKVPPASRGRKSAAFDSGTGTSRPAGFALLEIKTTGSALIWGVTASKQPRKQRGPNRCGTAPGKLRSGN